MLPSRWPKGRLVVAVAACTVLVSAGAGAVPAPSMTGLTTALGARVSGTVAPADVRWESSDGPLADYLVGRRVLFLASETARGPRDVYRARARLTPEGRVIALSDAKNLTGTPLGDDHALVLEGDHAAFATFVYGQEQTVTWLDLAGENAAPSAGETAADRLTSYFTRLDETGSGAGIERVEVSLAPPARAVGLALGPGSLTMDLVDEEGKRSRTTLLGDRAELENAPPGMHADVARRLPKRFILWAVDTVRAEVGPAAIAWLEENVFAVKDSLRRTAFRMGEGKAEAQTALADPGSPGSPELPAAALDASRAGDDGVAWPPLAIASIWKTPEAGEGEWQEPRLSWNGKHEPAPSPDAPPPAFYRTFVRPDQDRPYSRVILVAMDMRQLDLAMEAGTEDPKPLTGGHGPGRIPRDPATASRVVAAFNGGFKTEHGNYGMMVEKRILLPPQPNAATVVVLKDQRVGFGTWGDTHDVTGLRGIPDDDIVSFRQNLDPLVDRGDINPMGRALWGYTLPGSGMQTERSGMCVTATGQILYAWGDDVSGTALGKALKMAGCSYAMHLDMNPHHTGFIFSKIVELRGHNYHSELLTPLMTVSPDRYLEYAPKDFFYVLTHDATPAPVGTATFHPDPGTQPPPAWAPAIWSTQLAGREARDGAIELAKVTGGRARFRIRAGMAEPDAKTGAAPLRELSSEDAHRVVLAVGLGHALDKRPRGLATDGRLAYPMHALDGEGDSGAGFAALVADADGALSIQHPRDVTSIGPHLDLAELPLVLDDGTVTMAARHASAPSPRGALGVGPDGSLYVARGVATTDAPLAEALLHAGCRRAVALDRGAHVPPFFQRVGTETPPRGRADETALYVLSAPMKPRAFRFEAALPVAPLAQGTPRK